MAHGAFDGILQGAGLLGTESQDYHFLGAEHGGYAHGEGLCGHGLRVIVEEAGVHLTGVLGEGDHAGSGAQGREGLVESNVAVFAHAAQEQVETAGGHDGLFVGGALGLDVLGVAVQDVDVLGLLVNVVEEVAVHEAVVALGMLHGQAHVLVHVEGDDVLEGKFTGLDHADELGIGFDGSGTGAQADYERLIGNGSLFLDALGNVMGSPQGAFLGVVSDDDFHKKGWLRVNTV